MTLSIHQAKESVLNLTQYKTANNPPSQSNLGTVYLRCIGCNYQRFHSINETRGNDSIYWCKPCAKKAVNLIKNINDKADHHIEWRAIGKLFNNAISKL